MVYYVDVLFGVNAVMDTLALSLTAFSCRRTVSKKRLVGSGCFGGLWGCVPLFFPRAGTLAQVLVGLIGVGGAVWFLFLPKSKREWVRLCLMTLFTVCFLGGIAGWVWQNTNLSLGIQMAAKQMALLPLLASGCCGFALFRLLSFFFTAFMPRGSYRTTLRLWLGGQSTVVETFLDTGNFLRMDPKGRPMVLVSFRAIAPLLPLWVQQLFLAQEETEAIVSGLQAAGWESFPVSYTALGNQNGALPAVVLQKGECLGNGKVLTPLVAAIQNGSFGQAGEAIVHPSLLTE